MNLQEIFQTARDHLLAQDARAIENDEDGEELGCRYLAPDGKKCAVGCLIKPEAYNPFIEGLAVSGVYDYQNDAKALALRSALLASGIDTDAEGVRWLLGRLQYVHDDCEPSEWRHALRLVECGIEAKEYTW
jgi:hypothetical protein